MEHVERQARQGALTTTQLKEVLNDVAKKVTGDSLTAPATEPYVNDSFDEVGARATPATV